MENGAINAAVETLHYITERYGDDFVIHVKNTTKVGTNLEIGHFIFGCVDWSLYNSTRWHNQNKFFPQASVADAEGAIRKLDIPDDSKIVLFSNDVISGFSFDVRNEFARVKIDLSSAVFGKGTYYEYLTISQKSKVWQMYSQFPRGAVYNRQQGTLYECLNTFRTTEKKLEHPYQAYIDQYSDVYRDVTRNKRRFI